MTREEFLQKLFFVYNEMLSITTELEFSELGANDLAVEIAHDLCNQAQVKIRKAVEELQ